MMEKLEKLIYAAKVRKQSMINLSVSDAEELLVEYTKMKEMKAAPPKEESSGLFKGIDGGKFS